MYFGTKGYLKNTCSPTVKHALIRMVLQELDSTFFSSLVVDVYWNLIQGSLRFVVMLDIKFIFELRLK